MQPSTRVATFLLTDLEGSTALWDADPEAMSAALRRQVEILIAIVERAGGRVPKAQMEGDSALATFTDPRAATTAALEIHEALRNEPWPGGLRLRVRIGIHHGSAEERDGDWFGPTLNRAGRLRSAANGGQTLVSEAVVDALGELPAGQVLVDLGRHRLKDLAEPMRISELRRAGDDAPTEPPRTLERVRHNLPLTATSFVGREDEIRELAGLLEQHALITVTGPGGIGKTRLASHAIAELADGFPDGAWFVDLAAVDDAGHVARAIARVLGVIEQPRRDLVTTIAERLRRETAVLLLDNCEHVLAGAVRFADEILATCANVTLVATSREPLGVRGEHIWRIPPLPGPPIGGALPEIAASPAVTLFADRARAVRSGFELTAENAAAVAAICRRVEGMPLAIELAAARARMLSPAEIAERLELRLQEVLASRDARPPRQRTLSGAIAWSHDLLEDTEKTLFRQLSVFAGSANLAAIEEVCGGEEIPTDEVADLVGSLVDKSLVAVSEIDGESRFRMLDAVREFAGDRLRDADEEAQTLARHRGWVLRLSEEAAAGLGSVEQVRWLRKLDRDFDNVRAALRGAREAQDPGFLVQVLGALTRYLAIRGLGGEAMPYLPTIEEPLDIDRALLARGWSAAGRLVMDRDLPRACELLEAARDAADPSDLRTRYDASIGLANVALLSGRFEEASGHLADAAATTAGDDRREAQILLSSALVSLGRGDLAKAEGLLTAAREAFVRHGDADRLGSIAINLAVLASKRGDFAAGERWNREALERAREVGSPPREARAMTNLGVERYNSGDYDQAIALGEEALRMLRTVGDSRTATIVHTNLAEAFMMRGDLDTAQQRLEEAHADAVALGMRAQAGSILLGLSSVRRTRGEHRDAEIALAEALQAFLEGGQKPDIAATLREWAAVAAAKGEPSRAVELLAAERQLRDEIGTAAVAADHAALIARTEADARTALGDAGFDEAWQRGGTRGWEAVVSELASSALPGS